MHDYVILLALLFLVYELRLVVLKAFDSMGKLVRNQHPALIFVVIIAIAIITVLVIYNFESVAQVILGFLFAAILYYCFSKTLKDFPLTPPASPLPILPSSQGRCSDFHPRDSLISLGGTGDEPDVCHSMAQGFAQLQKALTTGAR